MELLTDEDNCRAVDNQIYVAVCSPARDVTAGYHAVSGDDDAKSKRTLTFTL